MRKIIILSLIMLAGLPSAFGQVVAPLANGRAIHSGSLTGLGNVVKSSAGLIYSITIVANSANASVRVCDAASGSSCTSPVYEVSSATSGNSQSISMSSSPALMTSGILVDVYNGQAFLSYQ